MKAVKRGYVDIVKLLLHHQKDFVDKEGRTFESYIDDNSPREFLDMFSNSPIILLLKAWKAECCCDGKSQDLFQAAENRCLRCCAKYIGQAGKLASDWTALMRAALNGHVEIVRLLVHKEARIRDCYYRTALMLAAEKGHLEVARLLAPLEAKLQDRGGQAALACAAKNGHLEIVRLLAPLEARIEVRRSQTALMLAAQNGYLDIVRLLIPVEAKVQMYDGKTALMYAAERGHVDCLQLLLPHEAGLKDNAKSTAAYCAVANLQPKCASLLLANEKEARDIPGQMLAAFRGDVGKMLQMQDAWDETLRDRVTILHFAFIGGSQRCMRLLLREDKKWRFSAGSGFDLRLMKGDPSAEIKSMLPVLVRQPDEKIANHIGDMFSNGNETCTRALTPFGSLAQSCTLKWRIKECKRVETVIRFLKLVKNVGFIIYDETLLDLDLQLKKELTQAVSSNPVYSKQIELARKQIEHAKSRLQNADEGEKLVPSNRHFSIREMSSEAAFNRFILLVSRDICWKSISTQRRVEDPRASTIRSKQERNRLLIRNTIRFVKGELRKMMNE